LSRFVDLSPKSAFISIVARSGNLEAEGFVSPDRTRLSQSDDSQSLIQSRFEADSPHRHGRLHHFTMGEQFSVAWFHFFLSLFYSPELPAP
jgi:hypothetical protein